MTLRGVTHPAFIGQRQRHIDFSVRVKMEFTPQAPADAAGLVLRQSSDYYYAFVLVVTTSGHSEMCLLRRDACDGDGEEKIAGLVVEGSVHFLRVEARGQGYEFFDADEGK